MSCKNTLFLVIGTIIVFTLACEKGCQKEGKQAAGIESGSGTAKIAESTPVKNETLTESGTFEAIEGKDTKYGLTTDKGGQLELDLAAGHHEAEFVPGLKVIVTGFNRSGSESGKNILVVEKLQFIDNSILLRGVFRKEKDTFFLGGVELDLKTNKLEKEYKDNKEVKVVGTYKQVPDKDKKDHSVLVVHRVIEI